VNTYNLNGRSGTSGTSGCVSIAQMPVLRQNLLTNLRLLSKKTRHCLTSSSSIENADRAKKIPNSFG